MVSKKISKAVTPAKAGVHKQLTFQDSRFHENDNNGCFMTFHELIKTDDLVKLLDRFSMPSLP